MKKEKLCINCVHGKKSLITILGVDFRVVWCSKYKINIICSKVAERCDSYEERD